MKSLVLFLFLHNKQATCRKRGAHFIKCREFSCFYDNDDVDEEAGERDGEMEATNIAREFIQLFLFFPLSLSLSLYLCLVCIRQKSHENRGEFRVCMYTHNFWLFFHLTMPRMKRTLKSVSQMLLSIFVVVKI